MSIARQATVLHVIRVTGPNGFATEFDHAGWRAPAGDLPPLARKAAERIAFFLGDDADGVLGRPARVEDVLDTLWAFGLDPLHCTVEVAAAAPAGPDAPHGWKTVYAVPVASLSHPLTPAGVSA